MGSYRFDPTSTTTIEQLIEMAAREASIAGESGSADVHHGRSRTCIDIAQLRLGLEDQKLRLRQIQTEESANRLRERTLEGNEAAARGAALNAEAMKASTRELAKSTNWLKWATWSLVLFTAVQAAIAYAGLFRR
jgi:hypothetical protein